MSEQIFREIEATVLSQGKGGLSGRKQDMCIRHS